jgi:hypothetical protein
MTQVKDQGALHHYRHEIPNIIDELLDLDPYEYRLYAKYKQIAGDSGECFRSNARLAKECKMGITKLKDAKKKLSSPFPKINNKPLIHTTPRISESGDPDTDLIVIIDIWPENMYYLSKKFNKGGSPGNGGVGRQETEGGSPGDYKEEHSKKNPIKKDNVSTLPSSQEKKKDSPFKTSPDRFVKKLTPEQKELHDKIIKYKPEWGESINSDTVCAWFNKDEPFTMKQVEDAFKIYKQDVIAAKSKHSEVKSMGATMRGAMNIGRTPSNDDLDFNREHAKRSTNLHPYLSVKEKYAVFSCGGSEETVEYNLPKHEFIRQFESKINLAREYS